jgi:hypothetical protein
MSDRLKKKRRERKNGMWLVVDSEVSVTGARKGEIHGSRAAEWCRSRCCRMVDSDREESWVGAVAVE